MTVPGEDCQSGADLLAPGEVEHLFRDRLRIGRSTYYEWFADRLPWVDVGPPGRSMRRLRRRDAENAVERAACGRFFG